MGGSDTTTTSTGSANPKVTATLNKLLGGIDSAYNRGAPPVFNESLYTAPGTTTTGAWARAKADANDPVYSNAVRGATGYAGQLADGSGPSLTETNLLDVANGEFLGNVDPEYQKMVDRAANGAAADINASIGADGRYASNVHVNALGDTIGALRTNAGVANRQYEQGRQANALSAIEGQRQQGVNNAFGAQAALPGLYAAAGQPAATLGAVGAAEDANAQARQLGRYDLNQRQNNAQTDWLAKLTSILSGNAQTAGTKTTTTTPATPWWMGAAGLAGALL